MSFMIPARSRLTISVGAILGLFALWPSLSGAGETTDSKNGATNASETASAATTRKLTLREPIPYTTTRKTTTELRSGSARTIRKGANGAKEVTYRVTIRPDGAETRRELFASRIVKKPISEIREEGARSALPSRGGFNRGYRSGHRMVMMTPTYYDPYHCGGSGAGRTRSGLQGGYGVVAVDPRFIPLGTRLYIEGYGYAVAADTGGAIKGSRIDLGIDTRHDASKIRSMKPVRVYIMD